MKKIVILGSTGSVGTQTLEVIEHLGKDYQVVGLQTHDKIGLLQKQIRKFKPRCVLISNPKFFQRNLRFGRTRLFLGLENLEKFLKQSKANLVVNAIAGGAGLEPTLVAVRLGIDVALANKESLVIAGEIIMRRAKLRKVKILPVDSEHSAIWQLMGDENKYIKRIILTCSGGPFFGKSKQYLAKVTAKQALKHPKWKMGPKISIDSATLMNKGLEVIEAAYLFNLRPEQIDVVVHPESLIHSFVEYIDGSVEGEMAVPDMRLPIQYALTCPERRVSLVGQLDLVEAGKFTFHKPDLKNFPCLGLAYRALRIGGTMPAVLNTANDIAVSKFLAGEIKLLEIPKIAEKAMRGHRVIKRPTLEQILEVVRSFEQKI